MPRTTIINPDAPRADLLHKPPTAFATNFHAFIEEQVGVKVSLLDVLLVLSLRKAFTDTPEHKEKLAKRKAILAAEREARERIEAKWAKSQARSDPAETDEDPNPKSEAKPDDDEDDDETPVTTGKSAAVLDDEDDDDEEEDDEEEDDEEEKEVKPPVKPARGRTAAAGTSKAKPRAKPAPY